MKSNFISNLIQNNWSFKKVGLSTFIVYFIISFLGWINLFAANIFNKYYFPLKSYLITFDKHQLSNLSEIQSNIYNIAGFKTIINTQIPYKLIDNLFFTLVCSILILLFYIGYKIIQSNKVNQTEIIKWSIIFSILMAFAIPSHSSDMFGYIARGAQQSVYHDNPYLNTVSKIEGYRNNPLFLNFMWPNQPATYGPVFIYLAKAIVFLSNNNFVLSFINFKLFNLTLFLLITLITLKTNNTKNIYLISWNPLIMIQGLWNCHNDLLSATLILTGVYLLLKENYFWSIFCLTIAAGIKYVSLLILPIVIFHLLKTKPNRIVFLNFVLGFCCGIILITILSIDYFTPMQHIPQKSIEKITHGVSLIHESLIAALFTLIKYYCKWQNLSCNLQIAEASLKYIFYSAFGLFYIWVLAKRKSDILFNIALVLFVFFAFVIGKFHSWYLLNAVVLIPFLTETGHGASLQKMLIALSMSHTYAITFLDQAKILNFVSMTLLPIIFILFKEKKIK